MQPPDSVLPERTLATTLAMGNPLPGDEDAGRILLGHVTGIHGLKGWVKVHSDTSPRDNIVKYPVWWLKQSSQWRQMKVVGGKPQGKTIIAKLDGIDTPETASTIIGASIAIDRSAMPPAGPGEYYWADLTGMQVRTVDGVQIGPVIRLFETGANDVVVIADKRDPEQGNREILVPWLVPDVITEVDMNNKTVVIDWDPDF